MGWRRFLLVLYLSILPNPGNDATQYVSPLYSLPNTEFLVGQTRYHSRVTDREEWLPVSIGVIASKHNDIMLAELIQEMYHSSGIDTSVKTGATAFALDGSTSGKTENTNEDNGRQLGFQQPLLNL